MCSFHKQNRIPFVVPERVLWLQMSMTLSRKFMSEVGTQRCLDENNLHFLAQKVFNKPDITEDFNTKHVTWSQFNKVISLLIYSSVQLIHSTTNLWLNVNVNEMLSADFRAAHLQTQAHLL